MKQIAFPNSKFFYDYFLVVISGKYERTFELPTIIGISMENEIPQPDQTSCNLDCNHDQEFSELNVWI